MARVYIKIIVAINVRLLIMILIITIVLKQRDNTCYCPPAGLFDGGSNRSAYNSWKVGGLKKHAIRR